MEQHPGLTVQSVYVNGQLMPKTELGFIVARLDRAYKEILALLQDLDEYEYNMFFEARRCGAAFDHARNSRNEISTLIEEFESNGVEIN